MPNPLLPYFGLAANAQFDRQANINDPALLAIVSAGQAGASGIDKPQPPMDRTPFMSPNLYGSFILVEPVFAERKDSGKFSIGKNGPVAHRHFVVPWGDNKEGVPFWKDYVEQLLGKTVLTTAVNGLVVVATTFPAAFHPLLPWLVCQEIDLEGEDWQGPDKYGMIQFRRALLKCKYTPLDFAEKVDTNVKFQSIPGHKWQWIGQDARRALASQVTKLFASIVKDTNILEGTLSLNIKAKINPGANPFFAGVVVQISSMVDSINAILPQISQLPTIASSHNATVDQTSTLQAAITNLQADVSNGTIQKNYVSTGLITQDRPSMAEIQSTSIGMLFWIINIRDLAVLLSRSLPANAAAQIAQVNQIINLMITAIGGLQDSNDSIATSIQDAVFQAPTEILGNVRIQMDQPDQIAPIFLQSQIDRQLNIPGASAVSQLRIAGQFGYEIRLFRDATIEVDPASTVVQKDAVPAATLHGNNTPSNNRSFYNGRYILSIARDITVVFELRKDGGVAWSDELSLEKTNNFDRTHRQNNRIKVALQEIIGLRGEDINVNTTGGVNDQWAIKIDSLGGQDFPYIGDNGRSILPPLTITYVEPSQQVTTFRIDPSNQSVSQLVRSDFLAGRFINNGHFSAEKHFILAPLLQVFLSLVSCVNQKAFRGFPPWTLLLESIQARKTHLMNGDASWTMQFKFGYNPNTWNATYRSETNQYEFVRAIGQPRPNRVGDIEVTLPALPAVPARPDGTGEIPARDATTIVITPQKDLTIFDENGQPLKIPLMTRGVGSPVNVPIGNTSNTVFVNAADYGMLYPVADFSIIDTFF